MCWHTVVVAHIGQRCLWIKNDRTQRPRVCLSLLARIQIMSQHKHFFLRFQLYLLAILIITTNCVKGLGKTVTKGIDNHSSLLFSSFPHFSHGKLRCHTSYISYILCGLNLDLSVISVSSTMQIYKIIFLWTTMNYIQLHEFPVFND